MGTPVEVADAVGTATGLLPAPVFCSFRGGSEEVLPLLIAPGLRTGSDTVGRFAGTVGFAPPAGVEGPGCGVGLGSSTGILRDRVSDASGR